MATIRTPFLSFLERHAVAFSAFLGVILAIFIRRWSKERVQKDEKDEADYLDALNKTPDKFYCGETIDYKWSQNEDDIEVFLPAYSGITRHEVKCEFHKTRVHITIHDKVVLEGKLYAEIDEIESTWEFDRSYSKSDKTLVCFILRKAKPTTIADQWRYVIKGHKELHPTALGPEIIKLDQNDPEGMQRAIKRVSS